VPDEGVVLKLVRKLLGRQSRGDWADGVAPRKLERIAVMTVINTAVKKSAEYFINEGDVEDATTLAGELLPRFFDTLLAKDGVNAR
jgi:hypothetical protein